MMHNTSLQPALPGLFPEPAPVRRQEPIVVHEEIQAARAVNIRQLVASVASREQMDAFQRVLVDRLDRQVELVEQEAAIFWSGVWKTGHGCYGKTWCAKCLESPSCPLAEILREEGRAVMGGNHV